MRCSRGEGWPLASTLSVFQFEAFSHYAVVEGDHNDCALGFVVVVCSGRDLIEEYLVCGICPLGQG